MRRFGLPLAAWVTVFFTFSTLGFADHGHGQCPSTIQYKGGRLLKSGDTYYYSTGRLMISGSTVYYPNGRLLKSGDTVYYETGRLLQSGSTLYYPSGRLLKSGDTYYYSNGRLMKSGSTFYYDNGRLARSGSTLYRPDGTITAFPIRLQDRIEGYGEVIAHVSSDSEHVEVRFNNLTVATSDVQLRVHWNGESFGRFEFRISTGHPNEIVEAAVDNGFVQCYLVGGGFDPIGESFSLYGAAAELQVRVRPGYDAWKVRSVLERALQSLE